LTSNWLLPFHTVLLDFFEKRLMLI